MNKAKEHEKKYEWLQAAEIYKKASDLVLKEKDYCEAAKLQELKGFCCYRAAFQAETNEQFRNRMKQVISTYKKAVEYFQEGNEEEKEAKINNCKAMSNLASSWLEGNPAKKRLLLDKWWNLKKYALEFYEEVGDYLNIGKVCTDLMQGSHDQRIHGYRAGFDLEKAVEENISLGEKAIEALSKIEDDYELARAYCWTSWFYGYLIALVQNEERIKELRQKCLNYSKKALTLSEKTGDSYLIGWANNAASFPFFISGNSILALKHAGITRKQGVITKDNMLIGGGNAFASTIVSFVAFQEEDPDKQKEIFEKAIKWSHVSIRHCQIISAVFIIFLSYSALVTHLRGLASIETNIDVKRALLKKSVLAGKEILEHAKVRPHFLSYLIIEAISQVLYRLSETETKVNEKRRLLNEAREYNKKYNIILQEILPSYYPGHGGSQHFLAMLQVELAKLEIDHKKKIQLFRKAVLSMENCLKIIAKDSKEHSIGWKSGMYGGYYYDFSGILNLLYSLTKDKKVLYRTLEVLKNTVEIFNKIDQKTHEAESRWQKAKVQEQLGEHLEAAKDYELASEAYLRAAEKIPQLKEFYENHSWYMQAWSQIEKARYAHSIEEYNKSKEYYENAAKLHESSEPWSYLASNYSAWAQMEKAESLSRKENTQQAKKTFQNALEQFENAEESIKQKIEEITSVDEKEMALRLSRSSKLRSRYCQARILLEDARLLDRHGKYLLSAKSYGEAAKEIEAIIKDLESEIESKELHLIGVLCRAWEKMALAEETTSSQSYLDAAKLFEQAKDLSVTKKTSLWALGNSSFCKGLAAGIDYQNSLDLKDHAKAKGHIKSAANRYLQAGFKNASEYTKATQRLFDAYLFMNQAESEADQEKRAKQYQMVENLLQISAGSFMKAKQPEKTVQVQEILATVREEKALAVSLNQVMQAPAIASTTLSFFAPTPTSEVSVGLESFEHANVQANLITPVKEVKVGESFSLSVEFVNAGREPALLTRVEEFIPKDFVVVKKPTIYRLEDNCLNMKGKQLAPQKLVEAKLVLQPSRKGVYHLKPKVHFLDELGQKKTLQLKSIEIKVEEVILTDRVSTGTKELDSLLLGGIPEGYAVALTGPPSDERQRIIYSFLDAGTKQGQTTFHITTEPTGLERKSSTFYLFLCNPKPKVNVPDIPNVYRLRGKTDLTNLSIALTKVYRNVDQTSNKKRVCVEIVSDVLLDYGAKAARKWVSELITDLTSKGFTMLAVMDPEMHPSDQLKAILNLFEGEISITQTRDQLECDKSIRVEKLRNQDYIRNSICLADLLKKS